MPEVTVKTRVAILGAVTLSSLSSGCFNQNSENLPSSGVPNGSGSDQDPMLSEKSYKTSANYMLWHSLVLPQAQNMPPSIIQQSYNIKGESRSVKFTGAARLSNELLVNLSANTYFYSQHVSKVAQAIIDSGLDAPSDQGLLENIFTHVKALERDPGFIDDVKQRYSEEAEIDCQARAAIFLADYMYQILNNPSGTVDQSKTYVISYVEGLVFDDRHAPDGLGHAWIDINGEVIDPSITPDGKLGRTQAPCEAYVPVVRYKFEISPSDSNFAVQQQHCVDLKTIVLQK